MKKIILVVDDMAGIRELLAEILDDFYSVVLAASAVEAKIFLSNSEILKNILNKTIKVLVITDLAMETRLAGIELIKWIEANSSLSGVLTLLMTGTPGDLPEDRKIFIDKPFKNETMLAEVRKKFGE